MSAVTNYVLKLSASVNVAKFLLHLNELIYVDIGRAGFVDVTASAGGNKTMECTIALAAINYYGPEDLQILVQKLVCGFPRLRLSSLGEYLPGDVQLFYQEDQDQVMREIFLEYKKGE